jgi:hypothetical protein
MLAIELELRPASEDDSAAIDEDEYKASEIEEA